MCLRPYWSLYVMAGILVSLCWTSPSFAETSLRGDEITQSKLEHFERAIAEQERVLSEQAKLIAKQQEVLMQQQGEIKSLLKLLTQGRSETASHVVPPVTTSGQSATEAQTRSTTHPQAGISKDDLDDLTPAPRPVGEPPAPTVNDRPPEIQALAEQGGVLTPVGSLIVEPSVIFSTSSVNRFTFRGIEIVDAVLIGAIEATDADRDLVSPAISMRYGVTDRFELEARVPYVYRNDRLTTLIPDSAADGDQALTEELNGSGLGDIEFAAHYQINRGAGGWPFFVGNLRYKSTTGTGPFDVDRTASGAETKLPTGSGFQSVESSLTLIYPTAPAVMFFNLGYTWSLADDIDKVIGSEKIGNVDPGDSVGFSLGLALAINEELSFTVGYQHDFIQETTTESNGKDFSSTALDVGSLLLGTTLRLSDRAGLNLNAALGITEDAPDVQITLSVPYRFDLF